MIRICSLCKRDLGEKPPYEDKRITHTLCPTCKQRILNGEEPAREDVGPPLPPELSC
jgi:DNA-directed RNA polymerase subunit RPC12/RpoP